MFIYAFFHKREVLYREQGGMDRNLCGCLVLLSDNYVHWLCIIWQLARITKRGIVLQMCLVIHYSFIWGHILVCGFFKAIYK